MLTSAPCVATVAVLLDTPATCTGAPRNAILWILWSYCLKSNSAAAQCCCSCQLAAVLRRHICQLPSLYGLFICCGRGVAISNSRPVSSQSGLHAGRGRRVRRMTPGKPGSWGASPAMSSKAGMGSQGTDDDDVWIPDTGQQQEAPLVSQSARSGSHRGSKKPQGGEPQQTEQQTPASAWDYPRQLAQSQNRPEVVDLTEDC